MNPRLPRRAAVLAVIGICAMIAVLIHAARDGDFLAEGGRLLAMPWGRATLLDVYVGLALFSGWVLWREANRATAAAWVVLILAGGNLVACCYVLRAVATAQGVSARFWMGGDRET